MGTRNLNIICLIIDLVFLHYLQARIFNCGWAWSTNVLNMLVHSIKIKRFYAVFSVLAFILILLNYVRLLQMLLVVRLASQIGIIGQTSALGMLAWRWDRQTDASNDSSSFGPERPGAKTIQTFEVWIFPILLHSVRISNFTDFRFTFPVIAANFAISKGGKDHSVRKTWLAIKYEKLQSKDACKFFITHICTK